MAAKSRSFCAFALNAGSAGKLEVSREDRFRRTHEWEARQMSLLVKRGLVDKTATVNYRGEKVTRYRLSSKGVKAAASRCGRDFT